MRRETVRWARRCLLAIILLALVAAGVSAWEAARTGESPALLLKLFDSLSPRAARHVGIVAGHGGSDSGAVCRDGLTEAQVNRTIAEAVASSLRKRGMTVDLLAEFDSRLPGYRADAFVSIHADSCEVELSGYKVASFEDGSKASAQLADCLWNEYGVVTGLSRHPDTVTYDMSRYHAFREIAAQTPAAIIETGFLKADRELLTQHPDRAAQGIVAGIQCFMDQR